jgi:hypothetical protein
MDLKPLDSLTLYEKNQLLKLIKEKKSTDKWCWNGKNYKHTGEWKLVGFGSGPIYSQKCETCGYESCL